MKRIPALDTVAGVAFLSELISNTIRIASLSGTRSLETSVKTCDTRVLSKKATHLTPMVLLYYKLAVQLERRDIGTTGTLLIPISLSNVTTKRGRTHLIVIHNRVHRLDPDGIDIPVKHYPLVCLILIETLHSTNTRGKKDRYILSRAFCVM